jgi:hypothetical protein
MLYFVGFQIVTLATMKSTIFWDVTSCSLVEILQKVGGLLPVYMVLHRRRWHSSCLL